MTAPELDILHIDNHLLVVNKPALLTTQGAAEGEDSLVVRARAYLKREFDKPGNVYIGVVSRLDSFVSGVVVLARTSKAADRLTKQFSSGSVRKIYRALVASPPSPSEDDCVDLLAKDDAARRMIVCGDENSAGKRAVLRYTTVGAVGGLTALDIDLVTGRKHQIRVQLAHRGYPIVGDRKYGSGRKFVRGIALHAAELEIEHPITKESMVFVATRPEYWP
jgi:23S rRNA pseudouridine1911/1915/1917 synthase